MVIKTHYSYGFILRLVNEENVKIQKIKCVFYSYLIFHGSSVVKNPPAMKETWVQSLDWDDPLEKEMATHSSIYAWETPWTEEPGRLYSPWDRKGLNMIMAH